MYMNKATITIAVFIVVIIGGLLIWRSSGLEVFNVSTEAGQETVAESTESVPNTIVSMISEETLAAHNTGSDCWVSYAGSVYDITDWVGKHPGGEDALIRVCGESTAFEEAINGQHGPSRAERLPEVGTFMGTLGIIEGAQS